MNHRLGQTHAYSPQSYAVYADPDPILLMFSADPNVEVVSRNDKVDKIRSFPSCMTMWSVAPRPSLDYLMLTAML